MSAFGWCRFCAAAAGLLSLIAVHGADSRGHFKPVSFVERFGSESPVSGAAIVGLISASEKMKFDPDKLILSLPDQPISGRLCMRSTTRDGRYWATAEYVSVRASGRSELPVTSKYRDQLRSYPMTDVAVRAEVKNDTGVCGSPGSDALLVTTADTSSEMAQTLWVMVNSLDGDVSAELDVPGTSAAIVRMQCVKADGTQIAFDRLCSVDLAEVMHGRAKLRVVIKGWTGVQDRYEESLLLP